MNGSDVEREADVERAPEARAGSNPAPLGWSAMVPFALPCLAAALGWALAGSIDAAVGAALVTGVLASVKPPSSATARRAVVGAAGGVATAASVFLLASRLSRASQAAVTAGFVVGVGFAIARALPRWWFEDPRRSAEAGRGANADFDAPASAERIDSHEPTAPVEPTASAEPTALLDSSALIDGRVPQLARAGGLPERLEVPRRCLAELQRLADSGAKKKRASGKRGLDQVERLRALAGVTLVISGADLAELDATATLDVDAFLVAHAREHGQLLVTVDQALTLRARAEGVRVFNLREAALALQARVGAGEQIEIELLKAGREEGQALAYLPDGSMIIVRDAAKRIGETVVIEIGGTRRTRAGQLYFARLAAPDADPPAADPQAPTATHEATP